MNLKITTWNLLANSLANEKLILAAPKALNLADRIILLREYLKILFLDGTVLVCQEVDMKLWQGIEDVFSEAGYMVVRSHYSTMQNVDYLGTIIAWPIYKFDCVSYSITRIGGSIERPNDIPVESLALPEPFPDGRERKLNHDVYVECQKRDTTLVRVRLADRITKKQADIYGLAMPCTFWYPAVTTLFCAEVMKLVTSLTDETPFIVAGDFNIQRHEPGYSILIGNPDDVPVKARPYPEWTIDPDLISLMDSDPNKGSTTKCVNGSGVVFDGCIDYIFCQRGKWKVVPEPLILERVSMGESLPSKTFPSDHIPVTVEFTII